MTDEDWKDYQRGLDDYDRQMDSYLRDVDRHVRYGERGPYGPLGRLSARPRRPIPPARLHPGSFVKPPGAGRKVRNAQELRAAYCEWRRRRRTGRGQVDFADWLGLTDDRQVRRYCRDYKLPWKYLLLSDCG